MNIPQLTARKKICIVLLLMISGYLFLAPLNRPLYDLAMFPFPDPRTPNLDSLLQELKNHGIAAKEVTFASLNGKVLHALFFENPGSKKVFLFSHGKGNNIYIQVPKAQLLLSCGASVFIYDYQGFGRSQGKISVEGACDDAVAAYDYLVKEEHRSANDIIGFGESFGSGVTGQLELRRKLSAVILHSGFASLKSAGKDTLFWLRLYPDFCFPEQMMDNVAVFSRPHPPLLIVHGLSDRVISYRQAEELYKKSLQPKQILTFPQGHCTFGRGNVFASTVRNFIEQNKL